MTDYIKPSRLVRRNPVAHAHQNTGSGYGAHLHDKQRMLEDLLYEEGLEEINTKGEPDYEYREENPPPRM